VEEPMLTILNEVPVDVTRPHRIDALIADSRERGSTTTQVHALVRSRAGSRCRSIIRTVPKVCSSFRRIARVGGGVTHERI
jgi:hypothetical protein